MRTLFATVTRPRRRWARSTAQRDRPLKRVRNFRCEFAFRDRGRMIHAVSRPGVFSHREVDPGRGSSWRDGDCRRGPRLGHRLRQRHAIAGGCLSGRGRGRCSRRFARPGRGVYGPGSKPQRAGQYHGCDSQRGPDCGVGTVDVVVANPPYYAGFRIAQFFLESARAALRGGGRIFVVTKRPEWYAGTCRSGSTT